MQKSRPMRSHGSSRFCTTSCLRRPVNRLILFTAPQFLRHRQRRKDLPNLALRVTMQTVRGTKNAPHPSREPISGKRRGAFLTTGHTTDGGVAHGDQSFKEWRKGREIERKSPQIIRNHAKKSVNAFSHPYGLPSPARFFLPIFRPIFRTFPSKLNISKIRFS